MTGFPPMPSRKSRYQKPSIRLQRENLKTKVDAKFDAFFGCTHAANTHSRRKADQNISITTFTTPSFSTS
jgi:hypothetical protein